MKLIAYSMYKAASSSTPTSWPVFDPSMYNSPFYYDYMMGNTGNTAEKGGLLSGLKSLFKGPITKGKLALYGLGGGSAALGLGALIYSKRKRRKEKQSKQNLYNIIK